MSFIGPVASQAKAWKRTTTEEGGGRFYDFGSHMIDQFLNLYPSARVVSVYGKIQFNHEELPGCDSHAGMMITLDNGVTWYNVHCYL
jgi:predicted dehydrogenase